MADRRKKKEPTDEQFQKAAEDFFTKLRKEDERPVRIDLLPPDVQELIRKRAKRK